LTNYLSGLPKPGEQHASVEVAALRRLAIGRRLASMIMVNRRAKAALAEPPPMDANVDMASLHALRLAHGFGRSDTAGHPPRPRAVGFATTGPDQEIS